MFPPMTASVHGLRMGSTRIIWVRTQWSVLQVCLNLLRQRTGEPHSAVFWAGSEIGHVSPHQNNDAIMSPSRGMARADVARVQ